MKIIDSNAVCRWVVAALIIAGVNHIDCRWMWMIAVIASVNCELYWYLWKKEKGPKTS